jgi:hypothetical protein
MTSYMKRDVANSDLRSVSSVSVTEVVGYCVIFDLLMVPHFPLFVVPYSLALVIPWAVYRGRVTRDRDLRLFFALVLCVTLSALLSGFYRDSGIVVDNIKRAGQLLTSFAYYFVMRGLAREKRFNVTPVLMLFLLYHTAWVLSYWISPQPTISGLARLYPLSSTAAEGSLLGGRFTYMFSDANTDGYLVAMSGVFLATFGRLRAPATALTVLLMIVNAAATGSRGVVVSLIFVCASWLVQSSRALLRNALGLAAAALVIVAVTLGGMRYYRARYPQDFEQTRVAIENSTKRLAGDGGGPVSALAEDQSTANRIGYYTWLTSNLVPLPLGRGYHLLNDEGVEVPPHSDALRMIYSYGIIAFVVLVLLLFRDIRHASFAIPALFAFSVNSLIDEQKLFGIFLSLLAIARVETARRARKVAERR